MPRYDPPQFDIETGVPVEPLSDMPVSAYSDECIPPASVSGRVESATRLAWSDVFFACGVLLMLLAAVVAVTGRLPGEYETAPIGTPLAESQLAVQERRIEALATRVTELEIRTNRTADAAAGMTAPGPAVTSTPYSYTGPLSASVAPPDLPYMTPTPLATPERLGVGSRRR